MSTATIAPSLGLEPTWCGLCGGDEAEPVAVGQDFDQPASRDTYLAVRCAGCGLLYLTPAPGPSDRLGMAPPGPDGAPLARLTRSALRRRIKRWARSLPSNPRILVAEPAAGAGYDTILAGFGEIWRLELAEPAALGDLDGLRDAFDGALLIGTLEQMVHPVGSLLALRRMLRPRGRVLVVSANAGSGAAAAFRGRHWSGYAFPRHRIMPDGPTLRALAGRGGFVVDALSTMGDPNAWIRSAGHLLRDWDAPAWLGGSLGPSFPIAVALAGLLEALCRLAGRGGLLVASLRPSERDAASP